MDVIIPFWEYWYFQIPNYILALLIYTLLGRLVLGLFVPQDWGNYIWRTFRFLTDWLLHAASWITPRYVPGIFLVPIAVFWLFAACAVVALIFFSSGLGPSLQPAS